MTQAAAASRRLSPQSKLALGLFARYATILGLVLMILAFSVLSPAPSPR